MTRAILPGLLVLSVAAFLCQTDAAAQSAMFVECSYDVVVADGGSFSSFDLDVAGISAFNVWGDDCVLGGDPAFADATLADGYSWGSYLLTGLDGHIAPGTLLLQCNGTDLIEADVQRTIDYGDIDTWADGAVDADGNAVAPPILCVTNIECDDEPYGFRWKGVPECGDGTYDGQLTAADAIAALRTATGVPSCHPLVAMCDINSDGKVTAPDALGILKISVQLPVTLSCPLPCNPGTIGPEGTNREFWVEVALVSQGDSVSYKVTPDPEAGEFTGDCFQVAFGPALIDTEGRFSGVAHELGPHALCEFRSIGAHYPVPADFTVTSKRNGQPVEDAIRIVRIGADY